MVDCMRDLTRALFQRGLPDNFVALMNDAYGQGDSWWRKLVDDGDIFVAVRGGYLNVYYRGNSLIRLDLKSGSLVGAVHYKYLLNPGLDEYVPVVEGVPQFQGGLERYFTQALSNIGALKKAADPYADVEKSGVHEILRCNPNIIDVEAAFGGVPRKDGKGVSAPRVDFVALQEDEDEIRLVFFEAKDFGNAALRAGGDRLPDVVEQVVEYRDLLEANREKVEGAYREVCRLLLEIEGQAVRKPVRDAMMRKVVSSEKPLVVDIAPRLVVFGFDDAQRAGEAWKRQERKLLDALPGPLLMKGSPKGFTVGISSLGRRVRLVEA